MGRSPESATVRPGVSRRVGLGAGAVGVGSLVANLLGYVLFLVLNRALPADALGAVASLLNVVIIASVAALSAQLVGAWRVATRRPDAHETAIRTGAAVGLVIALVVVALSPVVAWLLHIESVWPVLLVAAAMPPTCTAAGAQGALQGDSRFLALGGAYVVAAAGRAGGAVAAALAGWGVSGVMLLTTVGAWLSAAVILVMVRPHLRPALRRETPLQARRVLTGMTGTSALLVASTIDVPVARHVLGGDGSGAYAVLALFAKAAFWGPAFLATVLYPGMTRATRMRPLLLALVSTATIVVAGVVVAGLLSAPLMRVVGGTEYLQHAHLVPVFTALGGSWAIAQVLVYWGAARNTHLVGYLVWAAMGVATLVVVTAPDASVDSVGTSFLVAAASVACAGAALSIFRARSMQRRHAAEEHLAQRRAEVSGR